MVQRSCLNKFLKFGGGVHEVQRHEFRPKTKQNELGATWRKWLKYEKKKRDMIWKDGKKKFESTVVELDGH